MESITLHARPRARGTKGSLKKLRRERMLPGVVYGKEAGNLLVQVPTQALANILATHSIGGTLINLEISDGEAPKSYLVMIREVQREPLRQELLHVDFYQVSLTEEIETEIPVHLVGEAPGVKEGGVLQHMLREVTVSCLPTQLPERIDADISGLGIGDQLTVADLQVPPGVKIVDDPESIIVLVVPPVLEVSEEEEAAGEAGAAPEPGEG
ncbi:MAG: 50S ribosomal protein L25/general stress protein Ctc [Firmicutes bacterium]|nr:50S ribosomal protein L25/general stress protein Ctc [Bacillota bacterium]